jgi:hypothetical protein
MPKKIHESLFPTTPFSLPRARSDRCWSPAVRRPADRSPPGAAAWAGRSAYQTAARSNTHREGEKGVGSFVAIHQYMRMTVKL